MEISWDGCEIEIFFRRAPFGIYIRPRPRHWGFGYHRLLSRWLELGPVAFMW